MMNGAPRSPMRPRITRRGLLKFAPEWSGAAHATHRIAEDFKRARRLSECTTRYTVSAIPMMACHRIFVGCPSATSTKPDASIASVRAVNTASETAIRARRPCAVVNLVNRRASSPEILRRCTRWQITNATKNRPTTMCIVRMNSKHSETTTLTMRPKWTHHRSVAVRRFCTSPFSRPGRFAPIGDIPSTNPETK